MGVLSLLLAISSLLRDPLHCLSNSHKQSLSFCFDKELLPVLQASCLLPSFFSLSSVWGGNTRPQIRPLFLWKHQVFVSTPHCSCLFCSPDQRAFTTEPAPGLVSWTFGHPGSKGCVYSALLILSRVTFLRHEFPRLFCCSVTSSTSSLWNPSSLLLMTFFCTLHHSFHSTSKQTRVDCLAHRPPWGPSALWKTVFSHPGFVGFIVSNYYNSLLRSFKLMNGPVKIWDKGFKTPRLCFSNLLSPLCYINSSHRLKNIVSSLEHHASLY